MKTRVHEQGHIDEQAGLVHITRGPKKKWSKIYEAEALHSAKALPKQLNLFKPKMEEVEWKTSPDEGGKSRIFAGKNW